MPLRRPSTAWTVLRYRLFRRLPSGEPGSHARTTLNPEPWLVHEGRRVPLVPIVTRLLSDLPLDGPTNMARDEALLTSVGAGTSPPTLRLYQWDPPTVSLGYFQHYSDYEALPSPAGKLAVVRRMTGGGAILHDLELTYSLTLPLKHPLLQSGATRLYELAHDAIRLCLRSLNVDPAACGHTDDSGAARGPFFCFARRHRCDLLVGTDKIAGSAQRRTRRAVLQHGSIVLANRFDQQPTARVPGIFEQTVAHLRARLPAALAEVIEVTVEPGEWSADELTLTESLIGKYAGDEWTRRT